MEEAQIEAIARAYCRKLGLNADDVDVFHRAFEQAERAIAMQEAIAEVQAVARKGNPW